MARVPDTTALIQEIRDQSNERNQSAFKDDAIVRVLNRGLKYITSELARQWEEPLLARVEFNPSDYDREHGLPLPPDCFEERVVYVQVATPIAPTPVPMRSYTQIASLDIRGSTTFIPLAAYQRERHLFLAPSPSQAYPILVDYVRMADPIVQTIGRINTVGGGGTPDSVTLDADTMDLGLVSANSDNRLSYVNLVDGMTGEILSTRQVQRIDGSKVTFRSAVVRGEVEGRVVAPNFDGVDPEPDMYLCPVAGTCVPQYGTMFYNFLVEYSVAAIDRALGDALVAIAKQIADRAAEAARQQRAGRPNTLRVKNRSRVWGTLRPAAYPFTRQ